MLGNLLKLTPLVLGRLFPGAHAKVKRNSLTHTTPSYRRVYRVPLVNRMSPLVILTPCLSTAYPRASRI